MTRNLIVAVLWATLCVARAKSPVEAAMAERWDSLLFYFAALQSDYTVESPVFVLQRLDEGGQLIIHDRGHVTTRRLDAAEIEHIQSQFFLVFGDVPEERHSDPEPDPPEFVLLLWIDRGLNRTRLEKRLKAPDNSKALEIFARLTQELTPKK